MNRTEVLERACSTDCDAFCKGICPFFCKEKFDKCQRVKYFYNLLAKKLGNDT